jgi:hypothetical protein
VREASPSCVALVIPILDGLGGVAEGAQATSESVLAGRIIDPTALIATLLATGWTGTNV